MFRQLLPPIFGLTLFGSVICLGQKAPSNPEPAIREFPVLLQQNVVAGKTPVGTKVTAKLTVATLVNGAVMPRNAVFSGEVIESAAKTPTEPSRLSIRMSSEQWKGGSASIPLYLTAWYYPAVLATGEDLQYGPQQPANRTWNGQGQYPDANSKSYKPFPGDDSKKDSAAPDTSTSLTSNKRVPMKEVESSHADDGAITILSRHSNLKLNKSTTYVLASGDLPLPPPK